jgi:hypothetical protein
MADFMSSSSKRARRKGNICRLLDDFSEQVRRSSVKNEKKKAFFFHIKVLRATGKA